MNVTAIIVAAGRGSRAGGGTPKQFRPIGGLPILTRTLEAFLRHPDVRTVLCALHPDDLSLYELAVAALPDAGRDKLVSPAEGGATRQASVAAALDHLSRLKADPDGDAICLVHDAARPFVSGGLIDRAIAAAARFGAALPGTPVTDTINRVDADGRVQDRLDRKSLRAVQTPQAFRLAPFLQAHRAAAAEGLADFTDDGQVMEWAGHAVAVFEGDPLNMKVTEPVDFERAERRLGAPSTWVSRTGFGFDVHSFCDGDHVWLGGVRVPHSRGVLAHSDGDVILHAMTDALLGTIADGDIGTHFPPSDPMWRGAASDRFLAHAATLVRAQGGRIDHLDVMLLAERPRMGPHREAIRERLSAILDLPVRSISLKATTTEALGFVGRAEGLAAQAVASVRFPDRGA